MLSTSQTRRPGLPRSPNSFLNGVHAADPAPPVTVHPMLNNDSHSPILTESVLELKDGSAFRGTSFGAVGKSVAGECVFQTGKLRCFPT